jgi:hypothetical protein
VSSRFAYIYSRFSISLSFESRTPHKPTGLDLAPQELIPQILTAGRRINLTTHHFVSFRLTTTVLCLRNCAILLTLRASVSLPFVSRPIKGPHLIPSTESHDITPPLSRPPQDALLLSGPAHSYWSQIAFQRHLWSRYHIRSRISSDIPIVAISSRASFRPIFPTVSRVTRT